MKSRDQQLLEEAYEKVSENFFSKMFGKKPAPQSNQSAPVAQKSLAAKVNELIKNSNVEVDHDPSEPSRPFDIYTYSVNNKPVVNVRSQGGTSYAVFVTNPQSGKYEEVKAQSDDERIDAITSALTAAGATL